MVNYLKVLIVSAWRHFLCGCGFYVEQAHTEIVHYTPQHRGQSTQRSAVHSMHACHRMEHACMWLRQSRRHISGECSSCNVVELDLCRKFISFSSLFCRFFFLVLLLKRDDKAITLEYILCAICSSHSTAHAQILFFVVVALPRLLFLLVCTVYRSGHLSVVTAMHSVKGNAHGFHDTKVNSFRLISCKYIRT